MCGAGGAEAASPALVVGCRDVGQLSRRQRMQGGPVRCRHAGQVSRRRLAEQLSTSYRDAACCRDAAARRVVSKARGARFWWVGATRAPALHAGRGTSTRKCACMRRTPETDGCECGRTTFSPRCEEEVCGAHDTCRMHLSLSNVHVQVRIHMHTEQAHGCAVCIRFRLEFEGDSA